MVTDELLFTLRAPQSLRAGMRLRAGRVLDVVGGGPTGFVYRVHDEAIGPIAVREYFPPALATRVDGMVRPLEGFETAFNDGLKLFDEDGWQLAAQDHPGLLKVQQVWSERGTSYVAMPWCDGRTLSHRLRMAAEPPAQEQLCNWLRAVADALTLVHRRRGLHGHLSPEQVMLLNSGRLLVMEFSRARRVVAPDPRDIERDPFAALECGTDPRHGPTGPWTDVYALAAMLYFALCGRPPQAAVRRAAFDAVEPLAQNPSLIEAGYSEEFLSGIDSGLALRARSRPQSLQDFLLRAGVRDRRSRQRAIGESLLSNLPVGDGPAAPEGPDASQDQHPEATRESAPDPAPESTLESATESTFESAPESATDDLAEASARATPLGSVPSSAPGATQAAAQAAAPETPQKAALEVAEDDARAVPAETPADAAPLATGQAAPAVAGDVGRAADRATPVREAPVAPPRTAGEAPPAVDASPAPPAAKAAPEPAAPPPVGPGAAAASIDDAAEHDAFWDDDDDVAIDSVWPGSAPAPIVLRKRSYVDVAKGLAWLVGAAAIAGAAGVWGLSMLGADGAIELPSNPSQPAMTQPAAGPAAQTPPAVNATVSGPATGAATGASTATDGAPVAPGGGASVSGSVAEPVVGNAVKNAVGSAVEASAPSAAPTEPVRGPGELPVVTPPALGEPKAGGRPSAEPSSPRATHGPAAAPVTEAKPSAAAARKTPAGALETTATRSPNATEAPRAAAAMPEPGATPTDGASALSPRCPELLARQYTGRPLDASEREFLRTQCRP